MLPYRPCWPLINQNRPCPLLSALYKACRRRRRRPFLFTIAAMPAVNTKDTPPLFAQRTTCTAQQTIRHAPSKAQQHIITRQPHIRYATTIHTACTPSSPAAAAAPPPRRSNQRKARCRPLSQSRLKVYAYAIETTLALNNAMSGSAAKTAAGVLRQGYLRQ